MPASCVGADFGGEPITLLPARRRSKRKPSGVTGNLRVRRWWSEKETKIPDLDAKDRLLVRALRKNSRASLVSLARDVGLSRSATHDRITKMEGNGVIRGYTVRLAPDALPPVRAFLTVTYKVGESQTKVIDQIMQLPGVVSNHCIAGDIDSIIYCEFDTMRELSDLRDELAGWDSVVSITIRQIIASSDD
ncbi:Lrp/AsnC family transcriptional regulator [Altererythrobacter sp. MF3-039]|uniref:Lrp/AsnC family transcriptional regulator n=1 Tax=Altererythrobacter sp. MF3-039 TaxID=3252901 RepID=UPI00390CAF9F